MKKLSIFLLVVSVIALLYGCSHSGDAIFIKPAGDTVVTSREAIVDELGRLPTISFPSGARIEGLEENTLTPGVVVRVTEQKITSKNTAYFSNISDSGMNLYSITAFKNPSNSLEGKTYVSTTEKPLKITLPSDKKSSGSYWVGIKESDTQSWRYFSLSDNSEVLANVAGVRTVTADKKECSFNLFRFGIQFALFSYDGKNGSKLPETAVTAVTASSTASVLTKGGKYLEDLNIKGILKGIRLNSIKPSDLRARITYRSNTVDDASIKVNGTAVTQTGKADKTVPGYSFQHSFVVDRVADSNLTGSSGEFDFILNLKNIETEAFPSGFLIEFFNRASDDRIHPYIYSEFFSFDKKEVLDIAISADSGRLEGEEGLYELNPTFLISITAELSDSDKEKVEGAVSVTNVESDKITKDWNQDGLTIGFADELEPDTTYVLSVADVTDVEGISITDVEDLTFRTKSLNNFFAIVYDLDGGYLENGEANPEIYFTASESFTLINPTRYGYNFTGWTGSNGDTPQTTVSIESGSTGEKSYKANWSVVAYTITYELYDGILAEANPDGYNLASETFVLNEPVKEGYTFLGWTGSNGDVPQMNVTIEQGSKSDLSFTANYTAISYGIVYELDGGQMTNDNPTSYDITSATIILNNPTKEGYTFAGWTGTGLDAASMTVKIPQGSIGDRTYTANWSAVAYSITYELNGGTLAEANPDGYNFASETFVLNEPTKEGYTFLGWTGSNGDTPEKPLSIVQGSKSDMSFVANWSINSYRLDLVKGTGINTLTGDGMHEYNSVVNASCTMLDGYEFVSWSGDFTTETFNMPASNATMTANAKLIVYNIVYDLAEGALPAGLTNPATYDITSATITLNNPTKSGYFFTGWTEGTATFPTLLTKIPQGSTGDKSYTAHWIETLTFNLPNDVTLVMHKIPAGTFTMGCPATELGSLDWNGERNQHQVTLTEDFYIGVYEVTQAQYSAVMGNNPSEFQSANGYTDDDQRPVESVCYNDITTVNTGFLAQINSQLASQLPSGYKFDLPTEAQWEYACRAKTTTALNNGKNLENAENYDSNLNEVAWYFDNSPDTTSSVGLKAPNAWGLYDLHGNVLEWCKDWYDDSYYTTCGDCSDPVGPDTGSGRVRRGGSRSGKPYGCRSACRGGSNPSDGNDRIGFRLVLVKE